MVQAAVLDGLLFSASPFGQDGFAATKVDVGRGQVAVNAPGTGADLTVTGRDRSFRSAHGAAPNILLLIRPDGYIAQIATTDRATAIAPAVALLAAQQG